MLAEEDAKRREAKFGRLSRGWMVGSEEFKTELKAELSAHEGSRGRFELLGADREAQLEARAGLWEEKLQTFATALGVALDKLPAQRSAPEKVQLATAMKTATSVSNEWLAKRLRMGETASVSQYVRRFRLAGKTGERAFKQALSRVTP